MENAERSKDIGNPMSVFTVDSIRNDPDIFKKIDSLKVEYRSDPEILAILNTFEQQVAGLRLSKWLPKGLARKTAMVLLIVLSLVGMTYFHTAYWLMLLLLVPMFSPRCVGETLMFLGRLR